MKQIAWLVGGLFYFPQAAQPQPLTTLSPDDTSSTASAVYSTTSNSSPDSTYLSRPNFPTLQVPLFSPPHSASDSLLAMPNKKRLWTVGGLHAGLYGGSLIVLNEAWYKDYPRSRFHTFNDWPEWLQIDKAGHAWSAYQLSRASMASWKWAGLSEKKQPWIAGLSGFAFLTVIEFLDGHSAEWGWSWADFGANAVGSGMFIAQELAWKEQRISFKFSFHDVKNNDPVLRARTNELFGTTLLERLLKDYNGQTYWLSANLKSFMPASKLPPWLNLAVGYGATGMYGGIENVWVDEATGIEYNRSDIPRRREWYLAPDVDFTRIPTQSKWLRSLFFVLNAFKMPAPTLVLRDGRIRVYGLFF